MQQGGTVKTINSCINFVVKTATNVCALNYLQNASLNNVGQFLGRLVTRFPAAYNAFIGGVAISVISDLAEKGISLACDSHRGRVTLKSYRPTIKLLTQVLVRVAIGAGVFAAGTALTGGALLPAAITGAKFGAFLLVADKVSKVAVLVFRIAAFVAIRFVEIVTSCCLPEFINKGIIAFSNFVIDSKSPKENSN